MISASSQDWLYKHEYHSKSVYSQECQYKHEGDHSEVIMHNIGHIHVKETILN